MIEFLKYSALTSCIDQSVCKCTYTNLTQNEQNTKNITKKNKITFTKKKIKNSSFYSNETNEKPHTKNGPKQTIKTQLV